MSLLHVTDFSLRYPTRTTASTRKDALIGISFEIEGGDALAVTGPNGCGLTSLGLAVAGLAPRLTGGRYSGTILFDGKDVQQQPPGALAASVGLLLQDPDSQLFHSTIESEVAWGMENLGLTREVMRQRLEWALWVAGLKHLDRSRAPVTLSGGEKKRLALASVLAMKPRLLVLDQPSGGLTPRGREDLAAILNQLRRDEGISLLLLESDPDMIVSLTDRVIVLDEGKIIHSGTPESLYLDWPEVAEIGITLPAAARYSRFLKTLGREARFLTVAEAASAISTSQSITAARPAETPREAIVSFERVAFSYKPGKPVIRDISLTLGEGDFIALMGDNGAGKTTLCRLMLGLLHPKTGQVLVNGVDTRALKIGQIARTIGMAFQRPEMQIFSPTVREEIAYGPKNLECECDVDSIVSDFGLLDVADTPPSALSFSRRRLVALASIAAMQSRIIVLDEPFVGLDNENQQVVLRWLRQRHRDGVGIMIATHLVDLVAEFARRVIIMHEGTIAADGPAGTVFTAGNDLLAKAGLHPPFAIRLGMPAHDDLTPEAAARWAAGVR